MRCKIKKQLIAILNLLVARRSAERSTLTTGIGMNDACSTHGLFVVTEQSNRNQMKIQRDARSFCKAHDDDDDDERYAFGT
jgi:hypothetical protein